MSALHHDLILPDLWQQEAVRHLQDGFDVIVGAPTGAGKTFVFELFVQSGFNGKAVYTVPTRALANDKFVEWQRKGWDVGIQTGDLSHNPKAPIVVATLETQKQALINGSGPALLVIDEYQLLADPARGVNYEIAMAMAPAHTQLLLLSGSVRNPADCAEWLERCDRRVRFVQHQERPVPLDEVNLLALPDRAPQSVRGRWPRLLYRALEEQMGPVLVFVAHRKAAEELAQQLATNLPDADPLQLSQPQATLAGEAITRLLKKRIAYHHSGLSYQQRAGVIEPLAKVGQLNIVVATLGLAAGINFSTRSVLVLDRSYRVADGQRRLQPDELLQMFGRAGRRGLDVRGYILYIDGKARRSEARTAALKRADRLDWPSLIAVLGAAAESRQDPLTSIRRLTARLFSTQRVELGLERFLKQQRAEHKAPVAPHAEQQVRGGTVIEFRNADGIWERRGAPLEAPLADCWLSVAGRWIEALQHPSTLAPVKVGTPCRIGSGRARTYGREVAIARFPTEAGENRLALSNWLLRSLRQQQRNQGKHPNVPKLWSLEAIESQLLPLMPQLSQGGRSRSLDTRDGVLYAQLDYANATAMAFRDKAGRFLLNPPLRKRAIPDALPSTNGESPAPRPLPRSVAEQWHALGLIDRHAVPTRRGRVFACFNHGEGLAIAAALEDTHYPVDELLMDLANIRAGQRFNAISTAGRPMMHACRRTYGHYSVPGYLRNGLPEDYGDGASGVLFGLDGGTLIDADPAERPTAGDIERARIEWRSLLMRIAESPDFEWTRWRALKNAARARTNGSRGQPEIGRIPKLTAAQRRADRRWRR